jgi:hypothetical protein
MPMTVPYSDFLSSAETAGGQRKMTARKMKKARDSPERRRVECVLVGRDMLEKGREKGVEVSGRESKEFIYIYFGRTRRLFCHVID